MTEIRTAVGPEIDSYLESLVRAGPFSSKAELVRAALVDYVTSVGPIARGFDRENAVAPDGRVYQVEYAREAARGSLPGVGLVYRDGVLLAGTTAPSSRIRKQTRKVQRVGGQVAVLAAGLISDAHILVRDLQRAQPDRTGAVVDVLVDRYWQHTVDRTKRPLAAALLVASVLRGDPRLLYFDPSGAFVEYEAAAIGADEARRATLLEERYQLTSGDEAEALALDVLERPAHHEVVRLAV